MTGPGAERGIIGALGKVGSARMIALVASLVCTVTSVRIITGALGPEVFGAVSLIATLTALVPFADLGLGIVITNLTVDETHGSGGGGLRRGYSTTIWILGAIGLGLIAVSLVVSLLNGWVPMLGSVTLLLGDPNVYMPIFVGLFALWLLTGPAYRILLGLGAAALVAILQGITPILSLGFTLVLLWQHSPLYFLAYCPIVASLIVAVIALAIAAKKVGMGADFIFPFWRIGASGYRSLLSTGLAGMIFTVGAVVILQSDRLLLSLRGTAVELAIYSAVVPMFFAVQSVTGAAGSYLWPYYRRLLINGRLTHSTIRKHLVVAAAAGVAMGIGVLVLSPIYLALVGYGWDASWQLVLAISIYVVVQVSTLPATSVLTSPRWIRIQGFIIVACAVVKMALAWVFIPSLGAAGGLAASIVVVGLIQLPIISVLVLRASRSDSLDSGITSGPPTTGEIAIS